MKITTATLRLFKAIPIENREARPLERIYNRSINSTLIMKDTIKMGFILAPDVIYKTESPDDIILT